MSNMLRTYLTTKVVRAEPMRKDGMPGYRVIYPDGYESWSPVETFQNCSRLVTDAEATMILNGVGDQLELTDDEKDLISDGLMRDTLPHGSVTPDRPRSLIARFKEFFS